MNPHPLTKYRPAFTASQIQHILHNLPSNDPTSKSIAKILIPLLAKVEIGAVSPAYKLSETHMIKQAEISDRKRYENGEMDAEEEADYESKILGV